MCRFFFPKATARIRCSSSFPAKPSSLRAALGTAFSQSSQVSFYTSRLVLAGRGDRCQSRALPDDRLQGTVRVGGVPPPGPANAQPEAGHAVGGRAILTRFTGGPRAIGLRLQAETRISLSDPQSAVSRALVVWYGAFQVVHLLLNARYQLVPTASRPPIPFAPPPEGWLPQTVSFLSGMAVADLFNAALSLLFVAGFFRRARWVTWLGTLTLTVSLYAAIAFTWGAVAAGAPALGAPYLWVNVPFLPVVVLFFAWSSWVTHGKLP